MNFQTSKRIMCCFLAALILCCAVVRPLEARAMAVLPAAATLVSVPVTAAAGCALIALGVALPNIIEELNYTKQIELTLPSEFVVNENSYGKYTHAIIYDGLTYIPQLFVEYVLNYMVEPKDKTTPVLKATGYELTTTFQDIYNNSILGNADYEAYANDARYAYTFSSGDTGYLVYSNSPITYESSTDSGKIKGTGDRLIVSQTATGTPNISFRPDLTDSWTGNYSRPISSFGLAAMTGLAVNTLVRVIGNLAPDLDDDEEYQSWLARQKFFVVQPDNGDDDDPDDDDPPKSQPYLPLRLWHSSVDYSVKANQEDAQSGLQTQTPPNLDPVPGTATPAPAPDPSDPDPNPSPNPDPTPENPPIAEPDVGEGDTGSNILEWLQLIYKALVNIMLNIIVQIEQLQYLPAKIANAFEYLFGNIQIWIYEQIAAIEAAAQWIGDKINAIIQEIILLPPKIEIFFGNLGARIETAFQWIWEHLAAAFETLGSIITTAFEWIWEHLAVAFQNVIDTLNAFWQNLKNWMQAMADYLLNGLKTLFIPEQGYMDAKIAEMRGKFGIVDSALNTFDGLRSFFFSLGSKPPVIYIDLGAATGSYYFGGQTIFVDMRWYADYKPTMDLVLSAILWLWFVWRFMIALPGIIQGFSGYAPQNNGQTETGMVLAGQWYER